MQIFDVLASNKDFYQNKKWGDGTPAPKNDFAKLLAGIESVLIKERKAVGLNEIPEYEEIFDLLAKLAQMLPVDIEVSEQEISFKVTGTLSEVDGFDISDEYSRLPLYNLARIQYVGTSVTKEVGQLLVNLAQSKNQRYAKLGFMQLLIDWIWWGSEAFWHNPDTIGEGDESFSVSKALLGQSYLFSMRRPTNRTIAFPQIRMAYDWVIVAVSSFPVIRDKERPETAILLKAEVEVDIIDITVRVYNGIDNETILFTANPNPNSYPEEFQMTIAKTFETEVEGNYQIGRKLNSKTATGINVSLNVNDLLVCLIDSKLLEGAVFAEIGATSNKRVLPTSSLSLAIPEPDPLPPMPEPIPEPMPEEQPI